VVWCTVDLGWVTGTSQGLAALLTCGATCIVDECEFDVLVLGGRAETVSGWYTAPTRCGC